MRNIVRGLSLTFAAAGIAFAVGASSTQDEPAMFRGDAAHAGVYHTRAVRRFGGVQWRFQTGGMVQSSATVVAGTAYVGSGDGNLYALDVATGAERWRFTAERAITSSPAVARGTVYVGTRDNAFYAVDARTGKQRWKVTTGADAPLAWGFESGDLYTSSPRGPMAWWCSGVATAESMR